MKKSIFVLSLVSLATLIFSGGGYFASLDKVKQVYAEESTEWKRTDNFVDGEKFIIAKEPSNKIFVGSNGSLKSATFSDNLLTSVDDKYTYDECALTAEKVTGTDYFYLKNSSNKYIYADEDGYLSSDSSNKTGFKFVDNYLVCNNYYKERNWDYTEVKSTGYLYASTNNFTYSTSIPSTKNVTLFTKSESTSYQVTISANGGTGDDIVSSYKEGEEFTFPENPFTYSKHIFTGWSDGTNLYDVGDKISITSNMTITAQWRELYKYNINFYNEDGSESLGTQQANEGDKNYYLTCSFSKTGHRLVGWSTTIGGSVEYENGSRYEITEDIDLYAVTKKVFSDDKALVAIRTGKDAGLRFKYNLSLEQVNGTFDNNYSLSSFKYGVLFAKESEFKEFSKYGTLNGVLGQYNISNKSYTSGTWSMTGTDDSNNTINLSIYNIKAENYSISKDGSLVTFAGVLTGFDSLPEDSIPELEAKKTKYNTEFRAIGYVNFGETFMYTSDITCSYMEAVNEYLDNSESYNLSNGQVEELTSLREKYGQ